MHTRVVAALSVVAVLLTFAQSWAQQTVRMGHRDVRTTMIYTHVLNQGGLGVKSPLDRQASALQRLSC
jgi:hypothetical protein